MEKREITVVVCSASCELLTAGGPLCGSKRKRRIPREAKSCISPFLLRDSIYFSWLKLLVTPEKSRGHTHARAQRKPLILSRARSSKCRWPLDVKGRNLIRAAEKAGLCDRGRTVGQRGISFEFATQRQSARPGGEHSQPARQPDRRSFKYEFSQ